MPLWLCVCSFFETVLTKPAGRELIKEEKFSSLCSNQFSPSGTCADLRHVELKTLSNSKRPEASPQMHPESIRSSRRFREDFQIPTIPGFLQP